MKGLSFVSSKLMLLTILYLFNAFNIGVLYNNMEAHNTQLMYITFIGRIETIQIFLSIYVVNITFCI